MTHEDDVIAADLQHADDADLAELMNAVMESAVPPMHQLGVRVLELRSSRVAASVPLAGNSNHMGTMYAGTLFALAEMLGGALLVANFDAARFYPTVKDLQISYLRPASSDIHAELSLDAAAIGRLRTEVEALGKAELEVDAELTNASGEVVATSHGIYQIRARWAEDSPRQNRCTPTAAEVAAAATETGVTTAAVVTPAR